MENNLRLVAELRRASAGWRDRVRALPVAPELGKAELVERLRRYDFAAPVPLDALADDVADLLAHGTLHATHPRYFGLFNPTSHAAGAVADALAAIYNPQVGGWWHAPAANEIERAVLDWLLARAGLDPARAAGTFTTGGAEANLTAVLVALARHFPTCADDGVAGLERRPTLYASDQAHDSFVKIAHATGLGRRAVQRVASDERRRLDVAALAERIARDRRAGRAPFLVVATAGTTATGAIDPLPAIADLCAAEGLSLHVDAAWGGCALLSGALRHHLAGIERADTITWDAHKTLPVPMGAGMILARDGGALAAPFHVQTAYVPDARADGVDLYQASMQWSRRAIGLKVFMTIAELGAPGIAALVEHQASMADLLRGELAAAGWTVRNDSPLPIVCFGRGELAPSGERVPELVEAVVAGGAAWLSEVRQPSGESLLRACITNVETGPDDVRALVAALGRGLDQVRASAALRRARLSAGHSAPAS
ncbi:MAG TPA: pyridoxal-dependent decarboxylase [Kofleriaceae bacterium]|nr:pyridoxal-dependent decarboxylase [Kofleriaceae bacterium]